MARPSCLRLFVHFMRLAASRTFWTAGSKRPIRIAMIAMTTKSSIRVNPILRRCAHDTGVAPGRGIKEEERPGRLRSLTAQIGRASCRGREKGAEVDASE